MSNPTYYTPKGGLSKQSELLTSQAVFTESYAVIPKTVMQDIVTSNIPFWQKSRAWILARPLTGFAETFSQYIMEVQPGGGSDKPETEANAQAALFVTNGQLELKIEDQVYDLVEGSFAYIPPHTKWQLFNKGSTDATFHWIRKAYQAVDGIDLPDPIIVNEQDIKPTAMPDTEGKWATTLFVDPKDMRHDMAITIVTFEAGGCIPFLETHVMEHGLYVLEGKAAYRLNKDWVEVEAGDFMWLRAFCPQACYAGGPGKFRYLLYKDINRHMKLTLG